MRNAILGQAVSLALGLATVPAAAQNYVVPWQSDDNMIHVTIEAGTRHVRCLVDSGASMTTIPANLIEGTGFKALGSTEFQMANGSTIRARIGVVPEIRLAGYTGDGAAGSVSLSPAHVAVSPAGSECLIGQTALHAFDAVMFDYQHGALVLVQKGGNE